MPQSTSPTFLQSLKDSALRGLEWLDAGDQMLLGAAKGLGSIGLNLAASPMNFLQAIQTPGPEGPVRIPGATMPPPTSDAERVRQAVSVASLGMSGMAESLAEKIQAERKAKKNFLDPTLEDKIDSVVWGGLKWLGNDVLPGQEIQNLATRTNKEGKPLTAEEAGMDVGMGVLKTLPLLKPLSKLHATRGKYVSPYAKTVVTKGEIDAAKATLDKAKQRNLTAGDIPEFTLEGSPHVVATRELLDIPETRHIVTSAMFSKAFQKLLTENPTTQVTDLINRAIKGNIIEPEQVGAIAQRHGLSMAEASNALASAFREVSTFSGQTLEAISRPTQLMMGELAYLAKKGDRDAERLLRNFERRSHATNFEEGLNSYSAASRFWQKALAGGQKIESVRRAALTSQLATSLRNAKAQGLNSVVKIAEDALAGTLETVMGGKRDTRPLGVHYAEALEDVAGLVHRFTPEARKALETTLDNLPMVGRVLDNSSTFEMYTTTVGGLLKGHRPQGAYEWAKAVPDLVGTPNRLQEIEFRRWHFDAKLNANLKREGVSRTRFDEMIRSGPDGLPANLVDATADALEHALKMTFSARPQTGVARAILDFYNKIPLATAIGPTFPRFLANSWRWTMEHSPTQFFNLFDKEFRAKLQAGAEGGFRTAEAYQTLAKATSGTTMLMAAWHLRNSDAAGPKYYQIKAGTGSDGSTIYDDVRQYQPFAGMLWIVDELKNWLTKRPSTTNANERIDAITGMRRISETVGFAWPDIMRSLTSENPAVREKAWETPAGQYMASFLTPLRTLNDFRAAGGNPEASVTRDTTGQEMWGPSVAMIPGLQEALPAKIDPYTAKARMQEHPLARQLWGKTKNTITPLQELLLETPGMQLGDVVGHYGNATANNLVAEEMGKILQRRREDGLTHEQWLVQTIKRQTNPKLREHILNIQLDALKKTARAAAMGRNMNAFRDWRLRNSVPEFLREPMREAWLSSTKDGVKD